jgi:hypothetical protein
MNQMMNEHYVKNRQFLMGLVIGFKSQLKVQHLPILYYVS